MGFQVWKDEMECYQKQRLGQEPGRTAAIISQPKKNGQCALRCVPEVRAGLKKREYRSLGQRSPLTCMGIVILCEVRRYLE